MFMTNKPISVESISPFLEKPVLFDAQAFERSQQSLREYALHTQLSLPHQPFHYNELSPTPLDPYRLRAQEVGYYEGALMYMQADVYNKSEAAGLPSEYRDAVMNEVEVQHQHRSLRNDEAMVRLIQSDVDIETPRQAELLLRLRAGLGAIHEPARLLSVAPEMSGIEAMKATRLFDSRKLLESDARFIRGLRDAEAESDDFFIKKLHTFANAESSSLRRINAENGPRPYDYRDSIVVIKWVEAELLVDGVEIEAVSRDSFVCLPETLPLNGVAPNLTSPYVDKTTGQVHRFNMQPINVTKYYRVKQPVEAA